MKTIITTSWDDGHKLDLKLAELLNKYNLKGTFYIGKGGRWRSLDDEEVKKLANIHEIGAHTISHARLARITVEEAEKEIIQSKEYLTNLLNKDIKMFCYPDGEFNEEVKGLVKRAGFLGARTVKASLTDPPKDFFEFGTTIHIYPLSSFEKLRFRKWRNKAKHLFDKVLKQGGIFHIWGHSWEIEKYGLWEELEEGFKHISGRENLLYLTNSETLENI